MKPMLKYRGGKSKEILNILPHVPVTYEKYIEPFFGGGALFFYLEPRISLIGDINKKLIDFYLFARDNWNQLKSEIDLISQIYKENMVDFLERKSKSTERVEDGNEKFYLLLRSMFNNKIPSQYSDAALYFFINRTAYSGMIRYNSKGEFNVPYGRYHHLNSDLVSVEHSLLLNKCEIYNTDYTALFNKATTSDFMFLDPPYDCIFSDYGNKEYITGFNEDAHLKLFEDFIQLSCKALMVIGDTPLTSKIYSKYIVDSYDKNYSVNIRNRFKSASKHLIVKNYK